MAGWYRRSPAHARAPAGVPELVQVDGEGFGRVEVDVLSRHSGRALIEGLPLGSRVPAVLVAPAAGDRGDVMAEGRWHNGVWTVEFARKLGTGSAYDVRFNGTLSLGIAPFDNAASKHAYHLKPIRLVIE